MADGEQKRAPWSKERAPSDGEVDRIARRIEHCLKERDLSGVSSAVLEAIRLGRLTPPLSKLIADVLDPKTKTSVTIDWRLSGGRPRTPQHRDYLWARKVWDCDGHKRGRLSAAIHKVLQNLRSEGVEDATEGKLRAAWKKYRSRVAEEIKYEAEYEAEMKAAYESERRAEYEAEMKAEYEAGMREDYR